MIYSRETRTDEYITYDQMNILITIQKIWIKIAVLLRTYIKAAIYDTSNLKSIGDSLLKLPDEAYNIFIIFYGPEIAEDIKNLLSDFIETIMAVVENKKYGDDILTSSKTIELYQTADKIASYLPRINIYWDEEQWKYLLYQYIRLTISEIDAVINEDEQAETQIYTALENLNFIIANYIARGIIASQQSQNQ